MERSANRSQVVIVVPHHKPTLDADEAMSLRHLQRHLSRYPTVLALPYSIAPPVGGYPIRRFADRHFSTPRMYNRLLMSEDFYRAFEEYEFILIYQFDCLVFSDQLREWCARGYDMVGAPWFRSLRPTPRGYPVQCGNGGFSLRRIAACVDAIRRSRDPGNSARAGLRRWKSGRPIWDALWEAVVAWNSRASVYPTNEDFFFSMAAPLFRPGFRIAPPEIGIFFSFETGPRRCFELTGGRLPFGCHAWSKWDREFWLPHLLPQR